ncbi:hypothetical protein ACKS0A_10463 [Histoplasma ohiense]
MKQLRNPVYTSDKNQQDCQRKRREKNVQAPERRTSGPTNTNSTRLYLIAINLLPQISSSVNPGKQLQQQQNKYEQTQHLKYQPCNHDINTRKPILPL